MASLKLFSLEGKGLKLESEADIASHIQALKDDADVQEVRIQGNTLGVGASKGLADVLKTKKKLEVADLSDIFTSRLDTEIPDALSSLLNACLTLPNLRTINLSDNAFGFKTRAPLVDFLSQHTPLQHLILNNNGLGPEAGTVIANALSTLATKKDEARSSEKDVPYLETIVCGRNRLENGSMAAWAKAYEHHAKGMKVVRMVQNGIRQEGITLLLSQGLTHAKSLEVVDLEDNTFTITGAQALANAVGGWTSIYELGLGDCYLSARGGLAFTSALEKGSNRKLEVLKLPFNNLEARNVKALAEVQGKLPRLRKIELNGNKFSEDDPAVDQLRDALMERRDQHGASFEKKDDDDWGLDELDELESDEEEGSESGDEEEEEEEAKTERAQEVKQAQEAEQENVAQEKDADVDALADKLEKTELK